MPTIKLETLVNEDIQIVFDLSRSVDLHEISTKNTNEKAIAGRTSGLMELNETVTWKAKHLGFYQKLTTVITALEAPNFFVDEQHTGIFKAFKHVHFFEASPAGTIMQDQFEYKSPLGLLGKIADHIFLERYMTRFLKQRNEVIKSFAESDKWKTILPG